MTEMTEEKTKNVIEKQGQPIATQENAPEGAVLCALIAKGDEHAAQVSLKELARLADTADAVVLAKMTQQKDTPDVKSYFGSGKVAELKELCGQLCADLCIFDGELTPSQIRNLEKELDGPRVIDRSMLILDIFARHATSGEGKLQVELAQLQYTIPRLSGKGTELSRLGGGIGTRGPGETKLETDRRHLRRRIDALSEQLAQLDRTKEVQRQARMRSGIPKIAIAGYTNAGKSTLLNALTNAGILAQDKLFATLDPTTRKYVLPGGTEVLLTDTVGFIRNLPHHLIRAFRSTLQEVCYADLILLVVDASDPEAKAQLAVTQQLLCDLGAGEKPVLYVLNKIDSAPQGVALAAPDAADTVPLSAKTGQGLSSLAQEIERILRRGKQTVTLLLPHDKGAVLYKLHTDATVKATHYDAQGIIVVAEMEEAEIGRFAPYITDRFSNNGTNSGI